MSILYSMEGSILLQSLFFYDDDRRRLPCTAVQALHLSFVQAADTCHGMPYLPPAPGRPRLRYMLYRHFTCHATVS